MRLSQYRSLVFSSAQSLLTGLSGQALLVISGPLVARMLGVAGRGQLAALLIWPVLLVSFGCLGVPTACAYYLSRYPSRERRLLGHACRLFAMQAIILTTLVACIFTVWLRGQPLEIKLAAVPLGAMVLSDLIYTYAVSILQGTRRFTAFNVCRVLPPALYTAGVVVLFLAGEHRLFLVALIYFTTSALATVVPVALVLQRARPDWTAIAGLNASLLSFGVRGLLGSVSPVDTLPIDQLAIALFLSPVSLGLYVVGAAFSNLPRFVAKSVGMIAYPTIARTHAQGRGAGLVWLFFGAVTALNVIAAIALILMMPVLVHVFFGAAFAGAVPIARLLVVGTTIMASRQILLEGLRGLGRPGATSIAETAMYPWLLASAPILMLHYGAAGLAAALIIAYSVSLIVAMLLAHPGNMRIPSKLGLWRSWIWVRVRPLLYVVLLILLFGGIGAGSTLLPLPARLLLVLACAGAPLLILTRKLTGARLLGESRPGAVPPMAVGRQWRDFEGDGPIHRSDDAPRLPRLLYYLGLVFIAQLTIRPAASFTLSDWFFFASFLATCTVLLVERRYQGFLVPRGICVGAAVFTVGGVISSFAAHVPLTSVLETLKFAYVAFVWFWLGTVLLRTSRQIQTATLLWLLSTAVSGAGALAQFAFGNVIPGAVIAWGRMTGFTGQQNDLGGMAAIALIPALALASQTSRRGAMQIVGCGILLFIAAALLLSASVGALLAASIGLVIWLALSRIQLRLLLLIVAVGIGGVVFVSVQHNAGDLSPVQRLARVAGPAGSSQSTLWSRVQTYEAALQRVSTNPLVGVGLGAANDTTSTGFEVHDLLLLPWYAAGVLGFLGMILILVSTAKTARDTVTGSGTWPERLRSLALLASVVAFLAFGMGEPLLYKRYAWVSVALLIAVRARQRRTNPEPGKNWTQAVPGATPSLGNLSVTEEREWARASDIA